MPNELETKTHKAFLSLGGLIQLFIQAFPEAGVTDVWVCWNGLVGDVWATVI